MTKRKSVSFNKHACPACGSDDFEHNTVEYNTAYDEKGNGLLWFNCMCLTCNLPFREVFTFTRIDAYAYDVKMKKSKLKKAQCKRGD